MQKSIQVRLIFLLALLLTSSVLLMGITQSGQLNQIVVRQSRQRLLAAAHLAATSLTRLSATDPDWQTLAEEMADDLGGQVTLLLADGSTLADTADDPALVQDYAQRPEVLAAREAGEGWALGERATGGADVLYVAVQRGPLLVRLAVPLTELAEVATGLWQNSGLALLLHLIVVAAVALFLSHRLMRPLHALTEAARKLAEGDLDQRVSVNSQDEIGVLADKFNRLASANQRRFSQLASAKAQLETVLKNTVSGIFLLDHTGVISYSNPAAMRMLGFSAQDLPAHFRRLMRNPAMSEAIAAALNSSTPSKQDVNLTRPQERVVELNMLPIAGEDRFMAVFYDVSEARRLAAVRADLVANVSHELKTPVTSIHGFAETLLGGALEDRDNGRHFVEIIYRESHRLLRLVNDLLDLSRLELAPHPVEKQSVDLIQVLEDIMEQMAPKAEKQQIALKLVIGVQQAPLQGDPYRLGQAVSNLIENALSYTPPGGEVRVNLEFERGAYLITVRDTGIGIEPEHLGRIFERFYRADKARSRRQGGTGLGLSIVKHIVELHQGQVWAESKVGEGTAFFIQLPGE
ncbi:MAG: two-component system histidine kinase PnpS [Bacillota bacterium]